MQDVEENAPKEDLGDAEHPCKPESPGSAQDKSSPEEQPPHSLEGKPRGAVHTAFCDLLQEHLSAMPPGFRCALELVKEMKEILLSLLSPGQNCLRGEIREALDTALLRREAERRHKSPPVYVRGIFQVLGLMRMDKMNFTIHSRQPHLQEHSIQYEQARFQERLSRQPNQRLCLFLRGCLALVQQSLADFPGALVIEAELEDLGQKFVSLTPSNQHVFGHYYTEILKTLVPPSQAQEMPAESL
ncbi:LOW QUALITY PROTEIN: T-complex protein 11 homolog [Rhynchonycteris naso]